MKPVVVNDSEFASLEDLLTSGSQVEYDTAVIEGKTFRLASLTAEDFVVWNEMREQGAEGKKDAGAWIILRSLVDANGKRFDDGGDRMEQSLRMRRAKAMRLRVSETLLKHIFKLNGVSKQADEELKNA